MVVLHLGLDRNHAVMLIAAEVHRELFIDQPVMKALVRCFQLAVPILVVLHQPGKFLAVELGDVLEHHADVLRVVRTCELLVISSVLQDDSLAEILSAGCFQNDSPLLQRFVVIGLISNHHVHTAYDFV